MKCCNRVRRIASEMRKHIAYILKFEVRDPRVVGMVTVIGIDISKDLSRAKIYVTFLNNEGRSISVNQLNEKIKILRDASGFIRSLLAKDMSLRIVPELFFIYDNSVIESMRIYRLLNKLGI